MSGHSLNNDEPEQPEAPKKAAPGQPKPSPSLSKALESIGNIPVTISLSHLPGALHGLVESQIGYNAERERQALIETALRTPGTDAHRPEPEILRLTPRQREVLAVIADGGSYVDVSERLDMSRHTARKHLANIRLTLGGKTMAHCVAIAFRRGELV